MTDLQSAMARVDAVGVAGAALPARRPVAILPVAEGVGIADLASERAGKIAKMRKLAATAVSIAMKEGGHGEHNFTEASVTAIYTIAELLTAAMDARPVEMNSAFRQASAVEDRAKADAVVRALAGDAA